MRYRQQSVQKHCTKFILSALYCALLNYTVWWCIQYTSLPFTVLHYMVVHLVHCTIHLSLHSFSLKMCHALIDLKKKKHSALHCTELYCTTLHGNVFVTLSCPLLYFTTWYWLQYTVLTSTVVVQYTTQQFIQCNVIHSTALLATLHGSALSVMYKAPLLCAQCNVVQLHHREVPLQSIWVVEDTPMYSTRKQTTVQHGTSLYSNHIYCNIEVQSAEYRQIRTRTHNSILANVKYSHRRFLTAWTIYSQQIQCRAVQYKTMQCTAMHSRVEAEQERSQLRAGMGLWSLAKESKRFNFSDNRQGQALRNSFLAKLGPGGTDSPHFCMGRDCRLWDTEVGMECLFSVCPSLSQRQSCPIQKTRRISSVQSILSLAPCCPRCSLVLYKSEEHQFCGALLTERTVCGMGSGKISRWLFPLSQFSEV